MLVRVQPGMPIKCYDGMEFRFRIFKKISQDSSYLNWAEAEIIELKKKFPNVSLKSFSEFKSFLDSILPKLIHKYMLLSGAMKVCSTISPDFAEIACSKGFAVLIEHVSGHVRNIIITSEGPYLIDLSYIQFLCQHDLSNKSVRDEAVAAYRALYKNPYMAIKIEKLPLNELPHLSQPNGNYENQLYNPVESIDNYDIEESEEAFPERFKKFK